MGEVLAWAGFVLLMVVVVVAIVWNHRSTPGDETRRRLFRGDGGEHDIDVARGEAHMGGGMGPWGLP